MVPTVTLNNGRAIPVLGLGTWKSDTGEVKAAVVTAIRSGYRHIDCAFIYGNEKEVGEAVAECLAAGICTREELFITSKLWNDRHAEAEVLPALENTLQQLQLDYLDMYLIHWPVAMKNGSDLAKMEFHSLEERPIAGTWKGMEACVEAGKTKGIGVSNFSAKKLTDLLETSSIPPAINQVERHPFLQQAALVKFCLDQNIHVTCYSPLGSMDRPAGMKGVDEPSILKNPVIQEIALKLSASPAQVVLKWAIQQGTSTVPKSVNPGRLAENLAAAKLELGEDDMTAIAQLDMGRRYVDGAFWTGPDSPYTLENLWDAKA